MGLLSAADDDDAATHHRIPHVCEHDIYDFIADDHDHDRVGLRRERREPTGRS